MVIAKSVYVQCIHGIINGRQYKYLNKLSRKMLMHRLIIIAILMSVQILAVKAYGQQARFADFDRNARMGKAMTVVYFGGSLTWGANASDPNRTGYRGLMCQYLRERYPSTPFTFIDAAIGGTGSMLGLFRLQRDVLDLKPDLVFLDFTANDSIDSDDILGVSSYERLLREMISRNIPVVQAIFGFRYNFESVPAEGSRQGDYPPRVMQHLSLAEAYGTGVGNVFPVIRQAIAGGKVDLDTIWPFDGSHPDDPGYKLFFEAVRDGFEEAVRDQRVCMIPEKTLFPDRYAVYDRIKLVQNKLPKGWTCQKTYRTSLWYDGLSSRWMGDVAACGVAEPGHIAQALQIDFTGTFVGIIGEADENALSFKVMIDGQLVPPNPSSPLNTIWNVRPPVSGRLLYWREIAVDLPQGKHTLEIIPIMPDTQLKTSQLRIESVCVAGNIIPDPSR